MSHHDHDDFAQLRGAFDDPIAPSPSFAAHLKEEVMREHIGQAVDFRVVNSGPVQSVVADRGRILRLNAFGAGSWQGAAITAATIVAVLAIAFASLRTAIQDGGDGGPDDGIQSITAPGSTPQAISANPVTSATGGQAGMNPERGLGPIPDDLADEVTPLKTTARQTSNNGAVSLYGDIAVFWDFTANTLRAYDVALGQDLWTYPELPFGGMASDGKSIYLTVADSRSVKYGLAALDIHTGAERWFVPDPSASGFASPDSGPVVANGTVYMHDDYQTFYAIDAESGSVTWQVTLTNDFSKSVELGAGYTDTLSSPPLMAADDSHLYVITANQFFSTLDGKNGEVIANVDLGRSPDPGMPTTDFTIFDDVAYVTMGSFGYDLASPAESSPPRQHDGTVTAVGVLSGEIMYQIPVGPVISAPVVAGDRLVALTQGQIVSMDAATGGDLRNVPVDSSLDFDGMISTDGSTAIVAFEEEDAITIIRTDGESIVQQWAYNGNAGSVRQISAWHEGLLLATDYNEFLFIAPNSAATPESMTSPDASPASGTIASSLDSGWGGADRSFALGSLVPDFDDSVAAINPDDSLIDQSFSQVVGDVMIRQIMSQNQSSGYIEAVDLASGHSRWTFDGVASSGYSSDGEHLFIWLENDSAQSEMVALNLKTGAVAWRLTDPSLIERRVWSRGTIHFDGIVYASSGERDLVAVDAVTGKLVWHQNRQSTIDRARLDEETVDYPAVTNFAVQGDRVFIAWEGKVVEALDRFSGTTVWSYRPYQINEDVVPYTTLLVDEQRLYLSVAEVAGNEASDEQIIALDPIDGQETWALDDSSATLAMADSGEYLIAQFADGNIHAIEKATGTVREDAFVLASPFNNAMITANNDAVIVYQGDMVFQLSTTDLSDPVLSWDVSGENENALSGSPTPSAVASGSPLNLNVPSIWNKSVYIASESGRIWVIPGGDSSRAIASPTPTRAAESTSSGQVSDILMADAEKLDIGLPRLNPRDQLELNGNTLVRYNDADSAFEAYDLSTGSQLWSFAGNRMGAFSVDDTRLFARIVTGDDNAPELVAIDLATGKLQWAYIDLSPSPLLESTMAPIVKNTVVFIGDGPFAMVAIDAESGVTLWPTDLDHDSNRIMSDDDWAVSVADEQLVYVAPGDGMVHAISQATGIVVWSAEYAKLDQQGSISTSLAITEGTLYATSSNMNLNPATPGQGPSYVVERGRVRAIDTDTGLDLWSEDIQPLSGSTAIVNNMLIVESFGMYETVGLAGGERGTGISYSSDLLSPIGGFVVSNGSAYAAALLGADVLIFRSNGTEKTQQWRLTSVVNSDYVAVDVFAWNDGLLIRVPNGDFYRIPPSSQDGALSSPGASPETVDADTPEMAVSSKTAG